MAPWHLALEGGMTMDGKTMEQVRHLVRAYVEGEREQIRRGEVPGTWFSSSLIADMTGLPQAAVDEALGELVAEGVLTGGADDGYVVVGSDMAKAKEWGWLP